MTIWALADLHLAFAVPSKTMEVFGPQWADYANKIEKNWRANIKNDDLVLIPGDISWAMKPEEAKIDLDWIHQFPGTKVMIRGNHDYWWTSLSKVEQVLPSSIHLVQNNAFNWNHVTIGGTRLWDTSEYSFNKYIPYQENPRSKQLTAVDDNAEERERIFLRELGRLEMSLKCLSKDAKLRIAMTHYPPIGAELQDSRTARLLEKYKIDVCVFGHLHNVIHGVPMFGEKNGIKYYLTSGDYLQFMPVKIEG
jgi:predicted phosphohydrolase